jgi:uncharacterized protein YecE (DUF72 family)
VPRSSAQIRVGCSGWNYKGWKARFYPADLAPANWLDFYTRQFDTVEVNNTFYRLPELSTFARWREQVPKDFVFAVKASRFITHMKRLLDPEEPVRRLFSHAHALGPNLGPVLYQLPSSFSVNLPRLDAFLGALPRDVRHVMEFRHVSWYVDEVFACLERHGAALCLHDKAGSEITGPIVGPVVYVRFHGATGDYHGSYPDSVLSDWALRLAAHWREERHVYAYFNNDPQAIATRNAATLRAQITRALDPAPPQSLMRSSSDASM